MSLDAMGSDGQSIDLDSAPATYAYDGNGKLSTITIVWAEKTYVQTYTYTDGDITSSSGWVLQ